ncbi:MAG TPA: fatty acid desaturase [Kofleriaceae bacterium]|nr:fatty acid desaturase [Kofleriaceae bacterium]
MLDRISYSLFPALFLALIPIGLLCGIPWLGFAVGAVVVPIGDELIGDRGATVRGPSVFEVRLVLLALVGLMIWSLTEVVKLDSWAMIYLAGASSGYVLGAIGIAAAHELGHRRSGFDRILSQGLLAVLGYGHYQVAHSRHHVRAGLREDPATARREESLWTFLPRYWRGIWRDATDAAAHARGMRRHKPWLLLVASVVMLAAVVIFFGAKGTVFWLVQGGLGLFLIASVDFIQHWGLVRRRNPDGTYEKATAAHTWESPFWLSERVTLNLTRHNFHHLSPGKHCSDIARVAEGPALPVSYGAMVVLATIPPAFRRVMNKRLPAASVT